MLSHYPVDPVYPCKKSNHTRIDRMLFKEDDLQWIAKSRHSLAYGTRLILDHASSMPRGLLQSVVPTMNDRPQ